jgi:hypothetical protein
MTRTPQRIVSVINQLAMLRTGDVDLNIRRAAEIEDVLATAREAANRYRAAVLAHDDLARKLCLIFRWPRPEVWSGYVPPRTDGYGEYNSSPYRAALVPVILEALTRQNDWRNYDSDRLASVPERHIRAPWAELRAVPTPREGDSPLWPESDR